MTLPTSPVPGGIRNRITFVAVTAAATTAVAALAACSPSGSQNSSSSSGASTFVVARTGDIDKLDPHLATAFQTQQTLGLVYSRLVTTSATGQIQPDLASQWKVSPDGRTVTFTLRTGVTWQDGSPFTSGDVKASIERILNQSTGAVARSNLTAIEKVDAPDGATVVLHLAKPSASLLYSLATVNSSIESAKDISAGTVGKKPNGTGAFAWNAWNPGQQVVLTGNAKYYGGAPKIKKLEFRVIPDESSILSGMKAGAFQLGLLSDPGVARQAGKSGKYALAKQPALSYHVLMLNGRKGPLTEPAGAAGHQLRHRPQPGGADGGVRRRHRDRPHHEPGVLLLADGRPALYAGRRGQGPLAARPRPVTRRASRSAPSSRPVSTPPPVPRPRTSSRSSPRSA